MSHIYGHIEIPQQSLGVLKPVIHGEIRHDFPMLFTPTPRYKKLLVEGAKVGFHPHLVPWDREPRVIVNNPDMASDPTVVNNLVMAYDVVPWDDHLEAEGICREKANRKFKAYTLEKMCCDKECREWLEGEYKNFTKEGSGTREIVEKTMAYTQTVDFMRLYCIHKDKNNLRSTDDVVDLILKTVPLTETGFKFLKTLQFH